MDKFLINLVNDSDFEKIRRLRNSQKNVLRNNFQLSKLDQNLYKKNYFKNFSKKPTEILFSLNINKKFIGYGGLVHISHQNKRCELSFLTIKKRNDKNSLLKHDFINFINFAVDYAFKNLKLNKITTETFSFRRDHIKILKSSGFINEGILKRHVIRDGRYFDSIIYSLFKK